MLRAPLRPSSTSCPHAARRVALLALLLIAAASGAALTDAAAQTPPEPPATVRLYVLTDTVALGERFLVALAADRAAGTQALYPDVPPGDPAEGPLAQFGDAEALDVRRFAPRLRGTVRTDSLVYTVAAFAVDSAAAGPFEVRVVSRGDTAQVRSGVGRVAVRAETEGEGAPAASVRPPEPFAPLWPLVALVAALGTLAALLGTRAALRHRRRAAPGAPRPAPLPEALARLDALDAALAQAPPAGPPDARAHFAALADALRVYLARRLGVPATELTTAELDAALHTPALAARVPEPSRRALRGVLRLADLAKFAGLRPDARATAEAHARARDTLRVLDAALAEADAREAEARAAAVRAQTEAPAAPSA